MVSLSKEQLLTAAQIGIAVAVDYNPEVKPVKVAADITSIALDESIKSAEARNAVIATHLLMINSDAARLQELKKRDGNLDSPEAQAILDQFRENPFPADSTGMFLAKSVFSARVVIGTAGHFGMDQAMKWFFGSKLSKRLHIGEKTERIWLSKKSPVRLYTSIKWKYLKRLAYNTQVLSDRLMKAIVDHQATELGKTMFGMVLDQEVDKVLAEHPSRRSAVYALRSDLFNDPTLLAVPAPAPAVAAILPAPAVIRVPNDPVMRPAHVQHEFIQSDGRSRREDHQRHEPQSYSGPTGISGGSELGSFSFSY
jgi:hypothetical protein